MLNPIFSEKKKIFFKNSDIIGFFIKKNSVNFGKFWKIFNLEIRFTNALKKKKHFSKKKLGTVLDKKKFKEEPSVNNSNFFSKKFELFIFSFKTNLGWYKYKYISLFSSSNNFNKFKENVQ